MFVTGPPRIIKFEFSDSIPAISVSRKVKGKFIFEARLERKAVKSPIKWLSLDLALNYPCGSGEPITILQFNSPALMNGEKNSFISVDNFFSFDVKENSFPFNA